MTKQLLRCVAAVAFAVSTTAMCQVSTGTPSFASIDGGPFDSVNLGNLNVHLSVPVLHKDGRGMPFTYDLGYDSSVWVPVTSSGVTQWQPVTNWGWKGITEAKTGYLSSTNKAVNIGNNCTELEFTWTYHDSFGAQHPFSGFSGVYESPFHTCSGSTQLNTTTTDGSGYTINAQGAGATAKNRSGMLVAAPVNNTSGSSTVTDANGNQLTVNSSGQFFDTTSSSIPVLTVTGAGTPSSPLKFYYAPPSDSSDPGCTTLSDCAVYSMNYVQYTVATNFGAKTNSGATIAEYGATSASLVDNIVLPDGSEYKFTYEKTPGSCTPVSGTFSQYCVTARISSVSLPTGGAVTYTYSGGANGIENDGSAAGLTRMLSPTISCAPSEPTGCWQYSRVLVTGPVGPGSIWTTTVLDPQGNQTAINFAEDGTTTAPSYNFYETSRTVSDSSGTLSTTYACYNGNGISSPSSCATTAVSTPIRRQTTFLCLPDCNGQEAEVDRTYDGFGLNTEVDEYDYGSAVVGSLLRKTITAYTAGLTNGIVDRPASVTIRDSGNNLAAYTAYGYDETTVTATSGTPQHVAISGSRGNLTSVTAQATSSTYLYRKYTYYDTGTLSTSTDVSTSSTTNGATTTYSYSSGSCGNSFVTSIAEPVGGMSRSFAWNCYGGVLLSTTDENGNTSSTAYTGTGYTNVFWRPYSTTDEAQNTTYDFYYLDSSNHESQTETKLAFNGNNSVVDKIITTDGFGRPIFNQTRQGPSANNYDTVATCYNNSGQVSFTSLPYSASLASSTTACPSSNAGTVYSYDGLGRTLTATDSGGGSKSFTYTKNDTLETDSSPSVSKQSEFDALGRLSSVCEITAGTTPWPNGSCSPPQSSSAQGYLTKYQYDALGNLTSVTQNAQASGNHQLRTYVYDMLGRLTSETNPENSNSITTYIFDSLSSDGACGTITSAGNLVKRLDPAQNATCYSGYDALHRVGAITYPSSSTPAKHFVYDGFTLNGTAMANVKTRLAEAYTCTGSCSSKITDLAFSYWPTGQTTDAYELTPHSGSNYYYHVTETPWANGTVNTITNMVGLPTTLTYGADGEGRVGSVSASSGQNPVTSVTYDPSGRATSIAFGSSDSDSAVFDPNTGRMTQYQFTMGTSTDKGALTWNPNGSLQQLQITDQITPANSQTCNYTHDDIGRIASANCGASIWSQTFSYDPFGNINKSIPQGATGTSFLVNYDNTNLTNHIVTSPFSYTSSSDPNGKTGNMTADSSHAYGWDTQNRLTNVDSGSSSGVCLTYDALDRVVEKATGSSCSTSPASTTEIVYDPSGKKLALMNGSTLLKGFVPLVAGAQAVYSTSGLQYYRHGDWLQSSRLVTTSSRTLYYDGAYAPFGENYSESGTQDLVFTGQTQDTEASSSGGIGGLYDYLYRKQSPVQGRWLSPDPAGLVAANPSNPQSWNRYAYVANSPLNSVDEAGLFLIGPVCGDPFDPSCGGGGGGDCDPVFGCPCDDPVDPECDGGGGGGGIVVLYPGTPGWRQRRGGVWPDNETLGLPSGLNLAPLRTLQSLLGLEANFAPGEATIPWGGVIELGNLASRLAGVLGIVDSLIMMESDNTPCTQESDGTWRCGGKKWMCEASCNVQGIGKKIPDIDRVTGFGFGSSEDDACRAAKRSATQSAPPGTYARHCKCFCSKS